MKLGDKVEKVIEAVVPKVILEELKNKDCGCDERKQSLNDFDDWLNGKI